MDKSEDPPEKSSQKEIINSLIDDLTCDDVVRCQSARQRLVSIGSASLEPLIEALNNPREQVRWEVAKTLGQIANPGAIDTLLKTMEEDNDFDVRWVAAEGLAAIGKDSLVPLLKAMISHSDSNWFRSGAYHVAHNLAGRGYYKELKPVLVALEDPEPTVEVPVAAEMALSSIEKE